ncbi:MAG TPA: hypothetical protein VIS76_10145 [Pseudomonadales bacterium]
MKQIGCPSASLPAVLLAGVMAAATAAGEPGPAGNPEPEEEGPALAESLGVRTPAPAADRTEG